MHLTLSGRERKISVLLFMVIFVFASCAVLRSDTPIDVSNYAETIRVACVGNSITYGAGIENREENNYPVQLGRLLGEKWETRNFGVNGATMLKKGDKPYWGLDAFKDALTYNPHVVIIKLGTNDTKPRNWRYSDEYVADYLEMIKRFENLPSEPKIWICLPAPAYAVRWGIRESIITGELIPKIHEVAEKAGVPVIDLYSPLSGKEELFPDKIHPNAGGAGVMAQHICTTLTGK